MVLQNTRSIQGFRFVVQGVRPHKKTGMYWLRMRTPERLIEKRSELEALGVAFRTEIHRSLGTKDKSEAAMTYPAKRAEIERIWETWDRLLENGPDKLSERNRVALAGELAKQFFLANEENPHDVPDLALWTWSEKLAIALLEEILGHPIPISETDNYLSGDASSAFTLQDVLDALSFHEGEGERFEELHAAWQRAEGRAAKSEAMLAMILGIPSFQAEVRPALAAFLSREFGSAVDELLDEKGLFIGAEDRVRLMLEALLSMETAKEGIESRRKRNWGPVDALDNLPEYRPPERTSMKTAQVRSSLSGGNAIRRVVTFQEVIDAERTMSNIELAKHLKSSRTFDKYAQDTQRFVEWRNSDSLLTLTRSEVGRWRDEMLKGIQAGDLKIKPRTVTLRVTEVRAVLGWAIWHANQVMDGEDEAKRPAWHAWVRNAFGDQNPLAGIDLPAKQTTEQGARTHERALARELLKKCRVETNPAWRWIPWLIAYSGARIHEIAKLLKSDVREYEGVWYLNIEGKGSTKNRTRRIPLHEAVVAEGFVEFVRNAPQGKLFPGKWVVKELRDHLHTLVDFKGKPPFHGFRHLFRDLATTRMELAAAYYVEGRALPGSGKNYGGSLELTLELAELLNKIPPFLPLPNEGSSSASLNG